MLHTGNLSLFW